MAQRAVLWFRNDLRVRDNQLFHYAEVRQASELVAVYCIDPRHYAASPWGPHPRTGRHRARFLAQTLEALGRSLRALGLGLLVAEGEPEDVLPGLVGQRGVLAFQGEDTSEEQDVERAVVERLGSGAVVLRHWGHTLFHREDLGWDPLETLPIPFGRFLHGTCDHIKPRRELPAVARGDLPPPTRADGRAAGWTAVEPEEGAIAACMGLSSAGAGASPPAGAAIAWRGGEAAGLERLEEYACAGGLGTYHRTRNQLHGANHSSHLSPWLANGSLSPRTVYWKAKEYERTHTGVEKDARFDHVGKFIFEMCWRDYFRFYCAHFGAKVFHLGGPAKSKRPWRRDTEAERRWKDGQTGAPLVDALMRELRATGFVANRGRYVVASYLVHYLGIDWRVGADWFESLLLDHDVCSNYGEWASSSGVAAAPGARSPLGLKGRGPTGGRRPGAQGGGGDPWAKGAETGDAVFDPWEQARQYDRSEAYVRAWLPELRDVPEGRAHRPREADGYYEPLALVPFSFAGAGPSRVAASEEPAASRRWSAYGNAEGRSAGGNKGRGKGKRQQPGVGGGAPEVAATASAQPAQPPQNKARRWQARRVFLDETITGG